MGFGSRPDYLGMYDLNGNDGLPVGVPATSKRAGLLVPLRIKWSQQIAGDGPDSDSRREDGLTAGQTPGLNRTLDGVQSKRQRLHTSLRLL